MGSLTNRCEFCTLNDSEHWHGCPLLLDIRGPLPKGADREAWKKSLLWRKWWKGYWFGIDDNYIPGYALGYEHPSFALGYRAGKKHIDDLIG
jgi:hypothetical protein